jgi:hypothetical protein
VLLFGDLLLLGHFLPLAGLRLVMMSLLSAAGSSIAPAGKSSATTGMCSREVLSC